MTKLLTDRSFLFIEERKCSNCCKMFNHFCNTVVVSLSVFACKSLSLVTWSLSWFSINTVCVIQTKKDITSIPLYSVNLGTSWATLLHIRTHVRQRVSTDSVLFCLVRAVQSTSKIAVTFKYTLLVVRFLIIC